MGFSSKQLQALRRNLDGRQIRTREANGRELSYIEGWYVISEANRIFGFDGWSRETVESRCVLARENRGIFLAVYVAKVRITVQAAGATVVREGHGSGEGRGPSPGEVHDIALKAAETDATKRALATFGKPFGLELYRKSHTGQKEPHPQPALPGEGTRFGFHPDDTTPIPRPSRYYGRRQSSSITEHFRDSRIESGVPQGISTACPSNARPLPRQRSTKASLPWLNQNVGEIKHISGLLLHNHVSSVGVIRQTHITCALHNQERWASKSATSSRCHSAGATIVSYIRPVMKAPGGRP